MRLKDIFYINSAGVKIDLLTPPYMLQTGELFDYSWTYRSSNTSLNGGIIESFGKEVEQKPLTLSIINYGQESYYEAIDRFYEVTEYDVINKVPGKLCFGEYYLSCYLTASKKTGWESDSSLLDNEVTLSIEYPFWIHERKFRFYAGRAEEYTEIPGLEYPYGYPYEYASQLNLRYLLNDHFSECGFMMLFYGPAVNPAVRVAGHLYEVATTLYDGEYLMIDSRDLTIKKVSNIGEVSNVFSSRNTGSYIWRKIPVGRQPVTWSGSFGVDIILFYERSEPLWSS